MGELSREARYREGIVNAEELEYQIMNEMRSVVCHHIMEDRASEPNMVNYIALNCGWLPLLNGEKMTVHYGDYEYEIVRTK